MAVSQHDSEGAARLRYEPRSARGGWSSDGTMAEKDGLFLSDVQNILQRYSGCLRNLARVSVVSVDDCPKSVVEGEDDCHVHFVVSTRC